MSEKEILADPTTFYRSPLIEIHDGWWTTVLQDFSELKLPEHV